MPCLRRKNRKQHHQMPPLRKCLSERSANMPSMPSIPSRIDGSHTATGNSSPATNPAITVCCCRAAGSAKEQQEQNYRNNHCRGNNHCRRILVCQLHEQPSRRWRDCIRKCHEQQRPCSSARLSRQFQVCATRTHRFNPGSSWNSQDERHGMDQRYHQ